MVLMQMRSKIMELYKVIPIGKKNKISRQELMYKAKITDVKQFRQEIAKLKEKYIVIFDDGYYLPATKAEYEEFIEKMQLQVGNINSTIELAKQEMEAV